MAPVTIQGKALVRELSADQAEWDAPLPVLKEQQWTQWTDSLCELEQLQIERPYTPVSLRSTKYRELCVFSDASTMAISAVAYLKTTDREGHINVGFVMGKSKLAPHPPHTVPRLELCGTVLGVEMADLITDELDTDIHRSNILHRQPDRVGIYPQHKQKIPCVRSEQSCPHQEVHKP